MKIYENYPVSGVIFCNLFNATVALLGAFILFPIGIHVSILYLLYVLYLEFQIVKDSCVNCCYYGKRCFCGKGKCAAKLFKKGDTKRFCQKQMTWLALLPSFMVAILPIVCGAILLAMKFDWILLAAIIALGILGFPAQGIVHGWGCGHCKQRELGCPVEKLFSKKE